MVGPRHADRGRGIARARPRAARLTRATSAPAPARPPGRPSRRELVLHAVLLAAVSRAALFAVAWLGLRAVPRLSPYPAQLPDSFLPANPALDGWARWDAAHYVAVARYGYGDPASPSPDGGLGFFPVYPGLIRGLTELLRVEPTPGALAVSGLIVSNLAFLVAVALFASLASELLELQAAQTAVLLLVVSPFGLFFDAVYTESLFLLQIVGALLLARRGRWVLAGLVAGTASGTRLVGLALTAALLAGAWTRRVGPATLAAVAVTGVGGLAGFLAYTWWRFDDPLAYFHTQERWGGWDEHVRFYAELFATRPREALGGDPRHLVIVANVALALLFVALLPVVRRVADVPTTTLTVLLVVGQLAITWVSLGRYITPAVGVYLAGGVLLSGPRCPGWLRDGAVVAAAIALAALTLLHTHGFWVI